VLGLCLCCPVQVAALRWIDLSSEAFYRLSKRLTISEVNSELGKARRPSLLHPKNNISIDTSHVCNVVPNLVIWHYESYL
jgi:hypothetical protein